MQKVGRKSIVVETVIPNHSNPVAHFVVKVQANRNHGICDIVVRSRIPQEVIDEKAKKKKTIMKSLPIRRVVDVLSSFQGRQYDDPEVFKLLEDALYISLNTL